MKKIWFVVLLCLSLATACMAAEKVEAPAACKKCGMDRTVFAHSRMVVTYADGGSVGTCSLNCIAIEMEEAKGKAVTSLQVADYNTKKLTNAKKATWVIGGKKQGVMTSVAKWAFTTKLAAETFIKENGGKLATFDEALKTAEKEQSAEMPHGGHGDHKM